MKTSSIAFLLLTATSTAALLGCPLLKKSGTDGGEDDMSALADAATVSVSGTGAKNEANVLRYANETALSNEPAVIGSDGAHVRTFPGNGQEVAFLPKGTAVAKIAQYFSTGVLVMFDDASGDGSKLIGWVPVKAFDVAAPPPAKPVVVPPRIVDAGAKPVPPTPVADSGAPNTNKDAGGTPTPAADAGGGLPQPPKGATAGPPVGGKGPDGWALTEGMCRHKCAADTECPRGTKCAVKSGQKVCTADH